MQLGTYQQTLQSRIGQLKETGEIDFTAIPGYSSMDIGNQVHYEGLYVLACHPELLQQPPEDIQDLHALMYFIFQYNLSNRWINGTYIKVACIFNPLDWTLESGLSIHMKTGLYAPLLHELAPLQPSTSLYFSILMLSLALILARDLSSSSYRLLFIFLTDLMSGKYDQVKKNTLESQKSALEEPWLVNYLPDSTSIIVNPDDTRVQDVKEFLLGGIFKVGIFSPPQAPRVIPADENSRRSRRKCIIL